MAGAELPLLDQSNPDDSTDSEDSEDIEKAENIAKFDEDPNVVFAEEKEGWHGYAQDIHLKPRWLTVHIQLH